MASRMRHMKAALFAQTNKSDRNDARGIAALMRVGLDKPVHVTTVVSKHRRRLLQRKVLDVENELCGVLRTFGLKVGRVGGAGFNR